MQFTLHLMKGTLHHRTIDCNEVWCDTLQHRNTDYNEGWCHTLHDRTIDCKEGRCVTRHHRLQIAVEWLHECCHVVLPCAQRDASVRRDATKGIVVAAWMLHGLRCGRKPGYETLCFFG